MGYVPVSDRNYQKWDLEVDGVDDEHDVGGNPVNSDLRIQQLFSAIKVGAKCLYHYAFNSVFSLGR